MSSAVPAIDFSERPYIVIWEVTQACDLACVHCRASAQPNSNPLELSTDEGKKLIDEIAHMQVPVFVLTGGDPIKRPDLFELIEHARKVGVRVSLTPSATPLLTREVIQPPEAIWPGAAGGEPRRIASRSARRLPRNVGLVCPHHGSHRVGQPGWPAGADQHYVQPQECRGLRQHRSLDGDEEIALWSVFFLVPTGRGKIADLLSAEEFEAVFAKLYKLSRRALFHIKTTEAQHYRRYVLQQQVAERRNGSAQSADIPSKVQDTIGRAPRGLNDGKGFVFVSHLGEVFPSGFLPLAAGNVRSDSLSRIYRESPIFQQLRDDSQLGGKCGACEFRHICGGSRARAFALTGDPLAEEPCCAYVPKNYVGHDVPPPQWRRPAALHVL